MVTKIYLEKADINKIKNLCEKFRDFRGDIDCSMGVFEIDGKSLIGLLEMTARSNVFNVNFNSNDPEEVQRFREMIREYEYDV